VLSKSVFSFREDSQQWQFIQTILQLTKLTEKSMPLLFGLYFPGYSPKSPSHQATSLSFSLSYICILNVTKWAVYETHDQNSLTETSKSESFGLKVKNVFSQPHVTVG